MYSHCIHNWQNLKHQDSLQSMHEYEKCAPPQTTEYYPVLKRSEIHQAMERYRRGKKPDVWKTSDFFCQLYLKSTATVLKKKKFPLKAKILVLIKSLSGYM